MSEPEKIKEKPPVQQQQEKAREPTAPKTSQSAFDKVMEQQKSLQQSPLAQGKISEAAAHEQRVKEIAKWQDGSDDRRRKDDKDDTSFKDKLRQKEKGSETVTREAVVRGGEKKGFGQGGSGGGKGKGGFLSDMAKKQIISKKLTDAKGLLNALGQSSFAGKMALSKAALVLKPQQMQAIVNQIVQSIRVGKDQLGWPELKLILKESVFAGLRLRFTSKHGKVSIQFETQSRGVKDLFTAESKKIQAALEEKGIIISEITVS